MRRNAISDVVLQKGIKEDHDLAAILILNILERFVFRDPRVIINGNGSDY